MNEFGLIKLFDLKKQKQNLEQEIAFLNQQESNLRNTIYQLQHDQEYIEKIARERYMMALPGEKVYRIIREKNLIHNQYVAKHKKQIIYTKYFLFIISISICLSIEQDFKLKKYKINNITYFDVSDLIAAQQLKSTYYDSKEKLEIQINSSKIFISPNSSFYKINSTIFHLTHSTIYKNNKLLIPAKLIFFMVYLKTI